MLRQVFSKTEYETWASKLKGKPPLDRVPEHQKEKFKYPSKSKKLDLNSVTDNAIDCVSYFFDKSWEDSKVLFNSLRNLYNKEHFEFLIDEREKNNSDIKRILENDTGISIEDIFEKLNKSKDSRVAFCTFALLVGYVSELNGIEPRWDATIQGRRLRIGDVATIALWTNRRGKLNWRETTAEPTKEELKEEATKHRWY